MKAFLAFLFSLIASVAAAQNPTCPTRPVGQSDNSCASTLFVQQNPLVSIAAFGGRGDNTTDNTAALNNALASLSGVGGVIYFPAGKYKFNSAINYTFPAGNFSVSMFGAGEDATVLTWPNASGGITFNYAGTGSSVHVHDLTFTTGTTAGGNGLSLQLASSLANPALTANSDIVHVTFRGDDEYATSVDYWTTALNIVNVSNLQIESLVILGSGGDLGNGIALVGLPASSTYGVNYNISQSTFLNTAAGVVYGSFIQGVTIDQSNFTSNNGTSQGVVILGSQTGVLSELFISNSQFNVPTQAVACATAISAVGFSNNLVISRANSLGFVCNTATSFQIVGNTLVASSVTGTDGIITNTGPGVISGNTVSGYGLGIAVQSGAVNNVVEGNVLFGNSTALSNAAAATSNVIANNQGYNPVGVSSGTYAPASTATYTAGASPETDYLTGGTVTAVKIPNNAGTTICTTTPCILDLGPNETFSVTYTGAPTQTKSVH